MRYVVFCALVAIHATINAASIEGDWKYTSKIPDKVYGEPESLDLSIRVTGNKLCGVYMSAYRGGMRIAEGKFKGKLVESSASVVYEADWAEIAGEGKARLRMKNNRLEWVVTRPGPEPDYVLQRAVLQRAPALLERPKQCE